MSQRDPEDEPEYESRMRSHGFAGCLILAVGVFMLSGLMFGLLLVWERIFS